MAVDARGQVAWLPAPSLSLQDAYVDFLARLLAQATSPVVAWLHGLDLRRAAQLNDWITTQPRLQVVACPIALTRRAPPADEILRLAPPALAAHPFAATAAAPALAASPAAAGRPFITPRTSTTDDPMNLTHLQRLEAESIHIMREVVAETDNPVMLYSIGKDSAVMLHLARKAFFPSPPPFPLLHVDTTWKFRAMYEMRERMAKEVGMDLIVYQNPEAAEQGINPFTHGSSIHTDMWKTQGLKQALDKYNFDAAFGGARRDEEKSRAKERIFSFRSAQHRWDPKNQRPELWRLYNGRKQKGESIRVFPISNWTELDIWQYIYLENIPIVPLYFAAERPVVNRDGTLIMVDDDRMPLKAGEVPMMKSVRFRTLGCYPLSGAVESSAATLPDVIQEMLLTKTSERQGRMIDHDSAASMEKKKQEGYF
ncbi:MAG: sulfate adenylyltransferase subunit CysD [Burkholderiaceae bacterium]